jgi:hypothetical protein
LFCKDPLPVFSQNESRFAVERNLPQERFLLGAAMAADGIRVLPTSQPLFDRY